MSSEITLVEHQLNTLQGVIKGIMTIILLVFFTWLAIVQQPRLQAYDECYMAKYEDWSTDCVLTE